MVVDQLAAAAREDRRPVGKARPLLLAVVGREPSDAAPVRKHAAADSGFAAAGQIGAAARRNQSGRRRGVEGGASEKSLRNQANHGFLAWAEDLRGRKGALPLKRMRKRWRAGHSVVYSATAGKAKWTNGNSGLDLNVDASFRHSRIPKWTDSGGQVTGTGADPEAVGVRTGCHSNFKQSFPFVRIV